MYRFMLPLSFSVWLIACGSEAPKVKRVQASQGSPSTQPPLGPDGMAKSQGTKANDKSPSPGTGGAPPPSGDAAIPSGPTTNALAAASGPLLFDLASAKPALSGASLRVTASLNPAINGIPASMTLANFSIKAPAATGMVLYRPVLVLMKADGKEEQLPIGNNINLKIPKGRSVPLAGISSSNFANIAAGNQIKVRFSALEPLADAVLDGIPNYRECKAPQNFQAMATALNPCMACHSGLIAYNFISEDMATACGQNLHLIDASLSSTGNAPNMQRPLQAGHPATSTTGYARALAAWRAGEGL